MRLAYAKLGPSLLTLPDGETGARRNWVIHIVEAFREHPDVELVREGRWTGYEDVPRFRLKRGHRLRGRALDLGYLTAFRESYPVFRRLKAEWNRPDLRFQVGLAGAIDLALFTFGPLGLIPNLPAFESAIRRESAQIARESDGDVTFQVEVPAELAFVIRAPGPVRPVLAAWLASRIRRLMVLPADQAWYGIHLCLGDMNHEKLVDTADLSPQATLAGAIARRVPPGVRLEFVHVPFGGGSEPPPDDERYYAPLSKLALASTSRFIAGLVHDDLDVVATGRRIRQTERALGQRVDIATSCGLGRRSPELATATMGVTAETLAAL